MEQRKYYLDNIRIMIIMGLFVAHSCEIYHINDGFYIEGTKSLIPTLIYNSLRSWYMAILFFIAGLTTMYSLKKRTLKEYYIERCKRIFLPFVIGILFWVPIQSYFALRNHFEFDGNVIQVYKHFFTTYTDGLYGYDGGFTPSHLWFLIYLMVIACISFPIMRYKKSSKIQKININMSTLVLFTLFIYVVSYGGSDESIGKFFVFFVVGILLYDNDMFFEMTKNNCNLLCILGISTNLCMSFMLLYMDKLNIWTWNYAWMKMVWAISCTTMVFGIIGAGQKCLNKTNTILRYLSLRSFAIYYIHMTVLVAVAYYVLKYIKYEVYVQICFIVAISVIITFLLMETFGRMPLIRSILGIADNKLSS